MNIYLRIDALYRYTLVDEENLHDMCILLKLRNN